jgi:lipid A 3-O-deacylase
MSHSADWAARMRGPITLVLVLASAARGASAQASPAVQVRVDNDGFDFWKRPARRTDGEYTGGLQLSIELGRSPFWQRLAPHAPPCAEVADRLARCTSVAIAIGQRIYTPAEDSQPFTYGGWRRQRPYAGWLYANMTSRLVRRSTARELGLTLGVTGPPSLADQVQTEAHERMPGSTAIPVGWETQVRFEPGVILSARQRWLLFSGTVGGVRLLDAVVGAGASVGNVITSAEASADLRAGLNLSHPWRRARRRGPAEIVATIGVRGQAVARNLFLDGNTVRPDRRVHRAPTVADVRGAVGLRLGPVVLAYAVTERSREYETGPRSHTFASLVLGIGGTPDPTP